MGCSGRSRRCVSCVGVPAEQKQGCPIVTTDGAKGGRQSPRDSLFLLTVLYDRNGVEIGPAKVRNLSATGMLAEMTFALSLGEQLRFELRGIGTVNGVVVREEPERFRYGVRFDRPVDPSLARRPVTGSTAVPLPTPTRKFTV